jgi:hypothetical protein
MATRDREQAMAQTQQQAQLTKEFSAAPIKNSTQ